MNDLVVDVRDAFCLHPLPDGGAVAALRGLGLQVPAGQRLVLHGPNGSGKTTLLRVLAGEQRLAAGTAVVAGLQVSTAKAGDLARWRARSLGQVDQDPWRLLRGEFDVLTNVALQLRVTGLSAAKARSRAGELLGALGLADLGEAHPARLSGGQRQKVAVCAAVAHRPALVLADEPTGELDLRSASEVYALLDRAVREVGATLVLVTHDHRAATIADRVVRMRDGRISETWEPGGDGEESLVVDDRGWLRLPVEVRAGFETGTWTSGRVRALRAADGTVVLRADPATRAAAPPTDEAVSQTPACGPESGTDPTTPAEVLARCAGVAVSYDDVTVLDGLDLEVHAGALTVLTGRSGTGKSTLLRVLLGMQRPDRGVVELGGRALAGLDRAELASVRRDVCGVVSQQVHLVRTADAAGNLDLARAAQGLPEDPGAGRWLARLGLAGLNHRPTSGLSGGERQRVALARALVALDRPGDGPSDRPGAAARLLVLDEPTSQLDEASAELVVQVLRDVARAGAGVLVATHDPVLVAAADVVHALD
ncbi:energy-coupling factor transport system ATP-binding protein [Quadrisphaera granulorum]|uniref:Energy-coupling factor transport system ATP-binding protein n=1 Tax=Quadrisphaera granulorum TaxID=317664 RepID=A0A316A9N8_9ACTN|nr:ATP-binding cassette domain-containing protein [Quadrisphaera granulorum]PWJ54636.1 energy-coupling factor transport system ATP-binding protein [Quadrisphaera granulorum]SZE95998.1 energy-coupling factor transport system ATP-binding protein [Quadrisphaera granulorum]